jgi:hypothetical protein
MKTIAELRAPLRFHPEEINSIVKYFNEKVIDWNVWLPSRKRNLQRGFVWTDDQRRELIWSILMRRHIPRMAMINTIGDVYQVIDGKQRLGSMLAFYNNIFALIIDGKEYYYGDLPEEYKTVIAHYPFAYYIVYEGGLHDMITDDDKITWFKFINFAGTPQDKEYFDSL